jgi:hypothetical protein
MKAIWKTAAGGFEEAREAMIMGYSLPGTDAMSIESL